MSDVDLNNFIKDNLEDFLNGKGKENFTDDEHDKIIRISFLLNHIYYEDLKIVFKYEDIKVKISLEEAQESFMTDNDVHYHLMSLEDFETAYQLFRKRDNRDRKINGLLDD